MNCRPMISRAVTTITRTWFEEMIRSPKAKLVDGKTAGKVRGVAPKKTWPEYSSSNETPMAVMRTFSVGAPRSGR